MNKFLKKLSLYLENTRHIKRTRKMYPMILKKRMTGKTHKEIGQFFELTKVRIISLEKDFLKSLENHEIEEYKEIVKMSKK